MHDAASHASDARTHEPAVALPASGETVDPVIKAVRSLALCLTGGAINLAGRHVLAMCSGGIDSVVLVALLHRLPRGMRPAKVTVAWLDHACRSASEVEAERAAARAVASATGAGLVERRAPDGTVAAGRPGGLQAAARAWRYEVAAELALEHGADIVAAGHTASDQLETVLAGMAADAGTRGGAGGMPVARPLVPAGGGRAAPLLLVRPMLGIDRSVVEAVAEQLQLEWAEDPSNADPRRFQRNRIRHEVVPPLLAAWPSAGVALGRRAARSSAEREVRDALSDALLDAWSRAAGELPGAAAPLDLHRLGSLPGAARSQLVAAWLRNAGIGRGLTSRIVESVVRIADLGEARSGRCGAHVDLPRGACVRRDGYSLSIDMPHGAHDLPPVTGDAR